MSGTTERALRSVQGDVPAIGGYDTVRKVLLAAGVLSSLLYVLATDGRWLSSACRASRAPVRIQRRREPRGQ